MSVRTIRFLSSVIFGTLILINNLLSQSGGPSQPEAAQFEPVDATDLVNLTTGDFTYTIPLLVVPGPSGDFPLSLSYHSGIGLNQEATWVGLGWSVNPGAITRTVSGYPDDYRGDYVQSIFRADPRNGENFTVGLGLGYGPVGLNLTYDSHTGNFGVNAMMKLSEFLSLGIGSKGISGTFAANGVKLKLSSTSSDQSLSFKGFTVGPKGTFFKYSKSLGEEFGVSTSLKVASNGHMSFRGGWVAENLNVGFSLSSSGSGANFTFGGVGFSGSSTSSGGQYNTTGFGLTIPIPWGNISFSYSSWSWNLQEFYYEKSFGYLYQSEYQDEETSIATKKFERQRLSEYSSSLEPRYADKGVLYPSQDFYSVSAQGLNGAFQPFYSKPFTLLDKVVHRSNYDGNDLNGLVLTSGNTKEDVNFRFLGDQGLNLISEGELKYIDNLFFHPFLPYVSEELMADSHLLSPSGEEYHNQNDMRSGGKIIEVKKNLRSGKIYGFRIIDIDGKVYEFYRPVNNNLLYSWSKNMKTTVQSASMMGTPYATNWLLTAIKGPDYVDIDRNDEMNEGDWGYWVKFSYKKTDANHVWRSPYLRSTAALNSTENKTMSLGIREVYYLDTIQTESHFAVFKTGEREDDFSAVMENLEDEEIILYAKEKRFVRTQVIDQESFRIRGIVSFPGDWRYWLNHPGSLIGNKTVLKVVEGYKGYRRTEYLERKIGLDDIISVEYNATDNHTTIIYGWDFGIKCREAWCNANAFTQSPESFGTLIVDCGDCGAASFELDNCEDCQDKDCGKCPRNDGFGRSLRIDVDTAMLILSNLSAPPYRVTRKLDSVLLFKKAAIENQLVKAIKFGYDYELCQDTPNSHLANGVPGGKLTLKSLQFIGHHAENRTAIPPYFFEYDKNNNQDYEDHKWDKWGSYNSQGTEWHHEPPQTQSEADQAKAWSLTKITTPTGGSINIDYESDDYYHASGFIDLNFLRKKLPDIEGPHNLDVIARHLGAVGPLASNRISRELSIPKSLVSREDLEIGKYLILLEEIDPPGTRTYYNFTPKEIKSVIEGAHSFKIVFEEMYRTYEERKYILIPPRKVYGGGIRVKNLSLETSMGRTLYNTQYLYNDENGYSYGVASSLPSSYGESIFTDPHSYSIPLTNWERRLQIRDPRTVHVFEKDMDSAIFYTTEDKEWERFTQLYPNHMKSYGRPGPTVLYSNVTVSNETFGVGQNSHEKTGDLNGKTEYTFYTSKDYPYTIEATDPDWKYLAGSETLKESIGYLNIYDYSGIYGKPKSIIYYESLGGNGVRPVRQDKFDYSFSNELHKNSRVLRASWAGPIDNPNTTLGNLESAPLGMIQARSVSQIQSILETGVRSNYVKQVNRNLFNVYGAENSIIEYYYDDQGVASSIDRTSRNFLWDQMTGKALATASNQSHEGIMINLITPAYLSNDQASTGMGLKNMLTQAYQNTSFHADSNITSPYLQRYNFPSGDITSSEIITWKNWGNEIFRINDKFVYDGRYSYRQLRSQPGFGILDEGEECLPNNEEFPWVRTSNITKYNRFSQPVETVSCDGVYSASIYNCDGMPIASCINARADEILFFGFETEDGLRMQNAGHDNQVRLRDYFSDTRGRGVRNGNAVFRITDNTQVQFDIANLSKGKNYLVSFWALKGSIVGPNRVTFYFLNDVDPSNPIKKEVTIRNAGSWQYFEFELEETEMTNLVTFQIGLDEAPPSPDHLLIDGLRIHPTDAQMKTYEYYKGSQFLLSVNDENYVSRFFEYDALGRLIKVIDHNENLIQEYKYNYSSQ